VNGIGGTVKKAVWRHVRSGNALLASAKSFCDIAAESNPKVHVAFISSASIYENMAMLDKHWETRKPIPNTHKVHFIIHLV